MVSILIVDDWTYVFKRTTEYLRDEGHFVKQAANAREAMQALQEVRYDIAFIDAGEDNKVNGIENLTEAMERLYPSTIRVGWSAFYQNLDSKSQQNYHHCTSRLIGDELLEFLKEMNLSPKTI